MAIWIVSAGCAAAKNFKCPGTTSPGGCRDYTSGAETKYAPVMISLRV